MSSLLPPLFQVKKPKRFEYKPRYYDQEKERIEKLKQKYAQTEDNEEDLATIKARLSEDLRSQRPNRKTSGLLSSTKLLIYLALIALLLFLVLK
ncbi:MAG: hypothetical protein RRX93_07570 [Bacteroidales bacterium]